MGEHRYRPKFTQACPHCKKDAHVQTYLCFPGGSFTARYTFTGCWDCMKKHKEETEPTSPPDPPEAR